MSPSRRIKNARFGLVISKDWISIPIAAGDIEEGKDLSGFMAIPLLPTFISWAMRLMNRSGDVALMHHFVFGDVDPKVIPLRIGVKSSAYTFLFGRENEAQGHAFVHDSLFPLDRSHSSSPFARIGFAPVRLQKR
jgi:hypothetical protein